MSSKQVGTNWKNAMEFIPFSQVAKLEAIFTQDGQRMQNVYHYWFENPIVEADLTDLAVKWKETWDSYLKPITPNAVSLQLIKVTDLTVENGMGIEYGTGLPEQGGSTSPALPNNVTVAVKWTTGRTGRSYRGRTYHIGLREDVVTGNTIDTTFGADLVDRYTELVVLDLTNNDCVMVVASRVEDGVPRTVGLATPITNLSLDLTVDSQRRRLPGRGR